MSTPPLQAVQICNIMEPQRQHHQVDTPSPRHPRVGISATLGAQAAADDRSVDATSGRDGYMPPTGWRSAQENTQRNPGRHPESRASAVTMRIATLNVRGIHGGTGRRRNKLSVAASMMKNQKWSFLALQETHESVAAAAELERANPRIWAWANPGTIMSAGTIFLAHEDLLPEGVKRKDQLRHTVLEEGRAQSLSFEWKEGETITLVNIYAPNEDSRACAFFERVARKLRNTKPIVMGDFNHVEYPIDRQPARDTPVRLKEAMADMKTSLSLVDGWRRKNQGVTTFTWTCLMTDVVGPTPRSRLDRVLAHEDLYMRSAKWGHVPSLGLSDHDAAYAEFWDDTLPEMGLPLWRMATEEVENASTIEETRQCLLKCQDRINKGADPMSVWLDTKSRIQRIFENVKRELAKRRTSRLYALNWDLKKNRLRPDYATNAQVSRNAEALEARISEIKRKAESKRNETQAARYAVLGETVSKYWFATGKALRTSNVIKGLTNSDGNLVTDTDLMLEVVADHHQSIMSRPEMTMEREGAIDDIVNLAARTRLGADARLTLSKKLSEEEVRLAIKASHNGKAPGRDGFSYEFYKKWMELKENETEDGPPVPCIVSILTSVFNAPSRREKCPREYTQGLMALAYKKGDNQLAANYRPLTLLDTDYKLETKVLATRMGLTLTEVIHRDQAGFVPGRDILDHVRMAQTVAEYCEVTETDGCLLALDQEKAYDRIDHEYMWNVLDAYGVPEGFVERVKSLYANAETRVMVNKKISRPVKVERGVRQGDPMSCLLFDLAIEPLAEMLRTSTLSGLKIPGSAAKLICKLFADDTQVYLARNDDLTLARTITRKWCLASTAAFNDRKTEVIPMGSKRYREAVRLMRTLSATRAGEKFPEGARIIADGESVRILGGHIGHNVDNDGLWEPIVQKMERVAEKWSKRHLTMKGRALVASFLMLSKAQYMLMTNPPREFTLSRIEKLQRRLVWAGKKSSTQLSTLQRPIEQGGIGLPDMRARTEAARLMWIQRWRKDPVGRPDWTRFLDASLKTLAKEAYRPWQVSYLDQTWKVRNGHKSPLSYDTRAMLKLAVKHNVRVDALKFDRDSKGQMVIWRNEGVRATATDENSALARRLWDRHGVLTQNQLGRITPISTNGCDSHWLCVEAAEEWKRKIAPVFQQTLETPVRRRTGTKDGLDLTATRKAANVLSRRMDAEIILNPDVTHRGHLSEATRIFGGGEKRTHPSFRPTNLNVIPGTLTVYTDGSADKNGKTNSACGAGLWSVDPLLRSSVRVPGTPPTNNRGELAAVMIALSTAPLNQELLIRSDSRYTISFLDGGWETYENLGWLEAVNEDIMRRTLYLLRRRVAPTLIQKVKAHSGEMGNEYADEAAKAALTKDEAPLTMEVPTQWDLTGAKLSTLSYNEMYRWVKRIADKEPTTRAPQRIEMIQAAEDGRTAQVPTEAAIWRGLRADPIRRQVADFLWKEVHGRSACGPYFATWGGEWGDRQYCECGAVESMEHILLECQERPWRMAAWQEYRKIRTESAIALEEDSPPTFAEIMAIGARESELKGSTRLEKILISETAFMIWKLRNEMRIRGTEINPIRARNAVRKAILVRAKADFAEAKVLANASQNPRKKRRVVEATWRGMFARRGTALEWAASDYG